MTKSKAFIAMSGGVDSSVAALIMQNAGYDCIGGTMRLYVPADGSNRDAEDARAVATRLQIPFHLLDASIPFNKQVIDNFIACYESGATPNPCIVCNRYLKFGFFLQEAINLGCDYVVTGHYAQIVWDENRGRFLLYKAKDTSKDQSYFLYCLTQDQLAHTKFPLGALTKEQVRQIAGQMDFINARKKDSQDICFVPDGDYAAFIKGYTGKEYAVGDFLNEQGQVIGKHCGAVCYTIGQRKGLGLAMGTPVYVCRKDMAANTVTVGPNEALFRKGLLATDWNWISIPELKEPLPVKAKVRYRQVEQPATVYPEKDGLVRVEFDQPQRAITPGQAVVLYDGDMVVGGGTITEVL